MREPPAAPDDLVAALASGELRPDDLGSERCYVQLFEIVDTLAGEAAAWLAERGERGADSERAARELAVRLMVRLCAARPGQNVYLPLLARAREQVRALRILAAYDYTVDGPGGINALARRYRVSVPTVYRIIAQSRGRQLAAARDLFDGTEHAPR